MRTGLDPRIGMKCRGEVLVFEVGSWKVVLLLALCDVRTGSDLKLRTKLFGELVVFWVSAGRFKPLPPCNIIAQKCS